jgi:glycosyltransferase involved in cell wall biosynthesis
MDGSRFLKKYKDKVHVIPNGVDLDEFTTSQSKVQCRKRLGLDPEVPIVLFVGSLLPRKGVKELVESARQIMDLLPDFQMIFVGDGLLRSVLETRSSELGVRTHVHFSGFVSKPDERNAYYRAADVLVVPSIGDEMFPLVILEGFATGSALVVSDIKAFKSIVDHEENGLITTAGDPASLADAILRLFRSPDLRARISHNASALAERYSWTTVAARTAALYEAQRR